MALRIAGPATVAAPSIAALVVIAAAVIAIIVIPRATTELHLVLPLRTLLIAGRATALTAFPTTA